jgi:hypothetical protein
MEAISGYSNNDSKEVNTESKYICIVFPLQDKGRSHNTRINDKRFKVCQSSGSFKNNTTSNNYIYDEQESKINVENKCLYYHKAKTFYISLLFQKT